MRILAAQLNYTIGDFAGNAQKMLEVIKQHGNNVDMIVFSELCLSGYYPYGLINRQAFIDNQNDHLKHLQAQTEKCSAAIVIGFIDTTKKTNTPQKKHPIYNGLCVLHQGKTIFTYHKKLLTYQNLFMEGHYFEPGKLSNVFSYQGQKIGFLISDDAETSLSTSAPLDINNKTPIDALMSAHCDLLICLNGSPSYLGQQSSRLAQFAKIGQRCALPLVFVNQVGGNDDVIFDGASFVLDQNGSCVGALSNFKADLGIIDIHKKTTTPVSGFLPYQAITDTTLWYQQCLLGLQDYTQKCHFKKIIVGLSGGIDSALTTSLAAKALGAKNVIALLMPSKHSSKESILDGKKLCQTLNIPYYLIAIDNEFNLSTNRFEQAFHEKPSDITMQNMQARIRGKILMEYSNHTGYLVLTTSNKSELSVGYTTLYGDMAGGYNILGDLYKTQVYQLAHYYNQQNPKTPIPTNILETPPSAELAPKQMDTDTLPPYEILDPILQLYLESNFLSEKEIAENTKRIQGYPLEKIQEIHQMVDAAEFKRRQAPLILRIQRHSFTAGKKLPIAAKY